MLVVIGMAHSIVALSMLRKPGDVLEEATVSAGAFTFLLQRYTVAGYGNERQVAVWCKTSATVGIDTPSISRSLGYKVDSRGWVFLMAPYFGPSASLRDVPPYAGLPRERLHEVSSDIAYVDFGLSRVAVTFDKCATVKILSAPVFRQHLFVKGELNPPKQLVPSPAFLGHVAGSRGELCFRMNPEYLTTPSTFFDICTVDKGAMWFVRKTAGALTAPNDDDVRAAYSSSSGPAMPLPQSGRQR